MEQLDYQSQVWVVVIGVWVFGIGAFFMTFVVVGLMMMWDEYKEAIRGNVAIMLNVLGFVAIVLAEGAWHQVKRAALAVWSWTVPDFSAQDE